GEKAPPGEYWRESASPSLPLAARLA
ncbi:hypothetical protein A2U01_0115647, partial [Trifolium medium]|nr:hypothetical protein [Trifolium medium]